MNNNIVLKTLFKNSLILCMLTVIAGLLMSTVYEVTKTPREKQAEKVKIKAYQEVFEDAAVFDEYKINSDSIETYLKKQGIQNNMAVIDSVVTAKESTEAESAVLGYVITVTSKEGYGGPITLTVGIKNDGTVNGISIISITETAGLGMKAKKDSFISQFSDKLVDSFIYVKNNAAADNEIDAISSATITTNAITNGVNAGIYCFKAINGDLGGIENE